MQSICIGVNECADDILRLISSQLQKSQDGSNLFLIDKVNSEGSTSIVCSIKEEQSEEKKADQPFNSLVINVSNALADYIIRQYEEKLIGRTINANYCYFNAIEKKEIQKLSLKILKNEDKSLINSLFQMRRRNIIVRKLLDYFEGSDNLILDGFVNFRLKDYIKDLEEVVDKAVDGFLMEREYREFIRLLRYFVDIQDPKFEVIHVVVDYDNKYTLLDQSKREITNECIREFVNEISEGEINYDDLLVSSLITLAPKKVVIHSSGQFKNKELLETIKNVFPGKVVFCKSCEICMLSMVKSEQKK